MPQMAPAFWILFMYTMTMLLTKTELFIFFSKKNNNLNHLAKKTYDN